ncbi:hypothetical protein M8C21_027210 [Ambrosia artemisiifolia]|uniref:Uncharacterized protein n=1 Tax=Ambrosia artemisiifolia TaxID=4212 RepID=A0AAD5CQA3_AMBAR|nr:hypothetical protein M8C21_027210 [Ambrosia artemisiifolia]
MYFLLIVLEIGLLFVWLVVAGYSMVRVETKTQGGRSGLEVLVASKNKVSTLKGFPSLPSLEHLRLEENPILEMAHIEAASILGFLCQWIKNCRVNARAQGYYWIARTLTYGSMEHCSKVIHELGRVLFINMSTVAGWLTFSAASRGVSWRTVAPLVYDVVKDYPRLRLAHGRKGYAPGMEYDVLLIYIRDDPTNEDAFMAGLRYNKWITQVVLKYGLTLYIDLNILVLREGSHS